MHTPVYATTTHVVLNWRGHKLSIKKKESNLKKMLNASVIFTDGCL